MNARLCGSEQLQGVPVFASHGAQDQVTPWVVGAQNSAYFTEFLQHQQTTRETTDEADADAACTAEAFTFLRYDNDGHDISFQCQKDVKAWLEKWAT